MIGISQIDAQTCALYYEAQNEYILNMPIFCYDMISDHISKMIG